MFDFMFNLPLSFPLIQFVEVGGRLKIENNNYKQADDLVDVMIIIRKGKLV